MSEIKGDASLLRMGERWVIASRPLKFQVSAFSNWRELKLQIERKKELLLLNTQDGGEEGDSKLHPVQSSYLQHKRIHSQIIPGFLREFKSRVSGSDGCWPDQKQCVTITNVSCSFLRTLTEMEWRPSALILLEVQMAASSGYSLPSTSGMKWWGREKTHSLVAGAAR